jgi:Ca2+:H+ antiporter
VVGIAEALNTAIEAAIKAVGASKTVAGIAIANLASMPVG